MKSIFIPQLSTALVFLALVSPMAAGAGETSRDLVSVWNQRVNPATHPGAKTRSVKPVNWDDLKGEFPVPILRYVDTKRYDDGSFDINIEGYKRFCEMWDYYNLAGPRVIAGGELAFAKNSHALIDYLTGENVLLLSALGPGSWTTEGWFTVPYPGLGPKVPDNVHNYILRRMPNRFGGWEFSEEDDRYVGATAWRMPEYPVTRQQAYEYYMGFVRRHCDKLQNYVVAMQNTIFAPYMADFQPVRLIGGQMPEHKHNISMWCSLLRGASKQYGVLWFPNITSCNNPLGTSKSYNAKDMDRKGYSWGLSLSLLRRVANLNYMYGASAVQLFEPLGVQPHLKVQHRGKEINVDTPTPVARSHMDFKAWVAKHPDRGVMHTPVALVWDFYAGWDTPSKYGRGGRPFTVWGNLPYEKGDHQIDMVFRMLFPGYQDATFMLNEEGFLTTTPSGDIADVLMSNVPSFVLNQYSAAVIMGATKIEGRLRDTIADFISRGGSVATSAANLTEESAAMFGVRLTGRSKAKERYVQLLDKEKAGGVFRDFNECEYTLHLLAAKPGTEISAANWYGDPVVLSKQTPAGGQLLLFAADYGMSDRVGERILRDARFNERLGSPYLMLEHVQSFLKPWLRQWNIVNVQGPDIQYLTNVTEDDKKVIVTLVNNQPDDWSGLVTFKAAKAVKGISWMDDVTVETTPMGFFTTIKPHDMVVVELYADRPVVKFKSNKIAPAPKADELARISDKVIQDMEKYSARGMLEMPPRAYSRQTGEPQNPMFVNAWLFDGIAPGEWVPQIKKLGLSGVEIKATTLYHPEFQAIWNRLRVENMSVGAVHAGPDLVPFNFGVISSDDPDFIEPTLAWLEKTMEIMANAGIPRLILYPGYAGPGTLKSLKRLCKRAEKLELTVVLEAAPCQLYQKPQELIDVVKGVGSPVLKLSLDTGTTALVNRGEDIQSNVTRTWSLVSESGLLNYVHLSDLNRHPNGNLVHNHKPLGQGIIPQSVYKLILSTCHDGKIPVSLYLLAGEEAPYTALEQSVAIANR